MSQSLKNKSIVRVIPNACPTSCLQFPMGPGPDGPMGAMGAMEPHHMNGSLGGFKHSGTLDLTDGNNHVCLLGSAQFNLFLSQGLGIWTGCQRSVNVESF